MPFGTGRLCGCNNDFCMKTSLCNYNPLLNPYDSSSGIDKNPFEMKESFLNISGNDFDKIKGIYNKKWNNKYKMLNIYNIWYYNDSINNNLINLRIYYDYYEIYDIDKKLNYWNGIFVYNTTEKTYDYIIGSGTIASEIDNGLKDDINLVTQIYPIIKPENNKNNIILLIIIIFFIVIIYLLLKK